VDDPVLRIFRDEAKAYQALQGRPPSASGTAQIQFCSLLRNDAVEDVCNIAVDEPVAAIGKSMQGGLRDPFG
jgi:hypothetical protein